MSRNCARRAKLYVAAAEDLRDNPGQWQAYESKGNCVVLAGPGSGKTKTLTIKLARMLVEDVAAPRGIACITYNSECASELARRLDKLGIQESRDVFIGTIHSFCLKHLVVPYGRLAGLDLPMGLKVATPDEQERVFAEAVAELYGPNRDPSYLRTDVDRYRRTYLDRDHPEWLGTDEETARLIEIYERRLREASAIDFDDMMLLGLRLIEGYEWVRACLRAKFPIIAVDEYQDLGLALHRMVLSLVYDGGIRLFAVGDADQSIYGFAGAMPKLLKELSEMDGIEKVPLRFNYRSGQEIVEASEAALGEVRGYKAQAGYAGTIDFYKCPDGLEAQAQKIANTLIPDALKRRQGRTLGDIAVLYVDKNDGDVIETQVTAAEMKFIRLDRGAPYRKTKLIRWLEECAAWCGGGWKKGTPRLSMILSRWQLLTSNVRTEKERNAGRVALVQFLFAHRDEKQLLKTWLSDLFDQCLAAAFATDPMMRDEAEAFQGLRKASEAKGKLAKLTVGVFGGQAGASDHVNLITLHSAKGMEFDVVLMMGLEQGRIPKWDAKTAEKKGESRRLFYVGLTRARHEVHMLCSGFTVNRNGRRFDNGASEFMKEVYLKIKKKP
jgi:DNA helicase-2/ATP-dependent DNA helicase PcrA